MSSLTGCSTKQPVIEYREVKVPVVCEAPMPHCYVEYGTRVEKLEAYLVCLKDHKDIIRYCKGELQAQTKDKE